MTEILEAPLPFDYPNVVGAAEDALVLGGPRSALLDLAQWPPNVTVFEGEYILDAARESSHVWLCQTDNTGAMPRKWRLAYALPNASALTNDEPVPFALPDLEPVLAHMEEVNRRIESAHTHAVEEIVAFEDGFVLVPRYAGVGDRKWPYVYVNGSWKEERKLPPFETSLEKPERPMVKSVRLGDGAEVLLWGGAAFERSGGTLARTFEQRIEGPSYYEWDLVPAGRDGFFYLSSEGIREVHRGSAESTAHLAALSVDRLARGPNGMLLVGTYEALFLYDPQKKTIAKLPDELDASNAAYVGFAPPGLVIVPRKGKMQLLKLDDVLALPQLPVDDADLVKPPPEPAPAITGARATSRPRVAAFGDLLAVTSAAELRVHSVDAPLWKVEAPSTIVAIGALADAFAVLDEAGKLHVYAAKDGELRFSKQVAPNPRSIATSWSGVIAVLASGGVHLVRERVATRIPFESAIAGAFDAHGTLFLAGEHQRAALVDANAAAPTLRSIAPPPADVRAVAALADGTWAAIAGRSLLRFDPSAAAWTEIADEHIGAHLTSSPDGKQIAVERWARSIDVGAPGKEKSIHTSYGETFSEPADETITITGIAFLDDDRVVVGLGEGRANILLREGALKLDPFPGDPPSRWIFIHQGQILVAS